MNPLLSRFSDIALNSYTQDAARNSPAQPIIVSDGMPPIIRQRLTQAFRVNTYADWQQFAQLCGATALGFFADGDYDPHNADFKACCRLARIAHLRGVECLTQGLATARAARSELRAS